MSIAEQILGLKAHAPECVHDPEAGAPIVPGWESITGKLYVRVLSALEWNDVQSEQLDRTEHGGKGIARQNWHARFVGLCLVDAAGQRVFTEPGQIADLGKQDRKSVGYVYDKAAALNGLTEEADKKTEKN